METDTVAGLPYIWLSWLLHLEFYTITLMQNDLYIEIEEHTKSKVISHGIYLAILIGHFLLKTLKEL